MFTQTRPRPSAAASTEASTEAGTGAGPGAAGAPADGRGTPGSAWRPLTLLNGWQSAQGWYGTGDPSYRVSSDGMVYLSGSLTARSGVTGDEFAVLPSSAIPAHVNYLRVCTANGIAGTVWITPDGGLHTSGVSAQRFTSLAGLSFPSITLPRTRLLPLRNGWRSAQRLYDTGDPAYSVSNGAVHLSGSVLNSAGSPSVPDGSDPWTFAVLPPSVPRPSSRWLFAGSYTADRGPRRVAVSRRDGALNAADGSFTSLTGISYPADPVTWQYMTMLGDGEWCDTPAAAVIGDVVYLTGSWPLPGGYAGEFAVLPLAARPAHTTCLLAQGQPQGGPSSHVTVRISPDGAVGVHNWPDSTSPFVVSLAGLSYAAPA
jgi:hypothetical protein